MVRELVVLVVVAWLVTRGAADEKTIVEARWMRVEGFMVVERGDS